MVKLDQNNVVLAKAATVACGRNTYLEEIHSGISPISTKGDFSDMHVVMLWAIKFRG